MSHFIQSHRQRGGIKPMLILAVVALFFTGLFFMSYLPGKRRDEQTRKVARSNAESAPVVSVFKLGKRATNAEVEIPGNVQAIIEVPIFARTSGYLQHRFVDIGDHVTSGQLLAEIESPETDQLLRTAKANVLEQKAAVIQAQSKFDLAKVTYARQKALVDQKAVSQQDADQSQANFAVAQADLEAAKATLAARESEVGRLVELTMYQEIKAPFAGVITARNVDEGALINEGTGVATSSGGAGGTSGGGNNSGKELFRLSDPTILRVYSNVPQRYAAFIKQDQEAKVRIQEVTAQPFIGRVTRTAGAVDPANRTMLTEVQIPNTEGKLLAGMYAQVKFVMDNKAQPLLIPSNALLVRPEGLKVAVVGADNKVTLQKAEVGRDYGTEIELLSGAKEGDRIVTTPPDDLTDGSRVEIPATQVGDGATSK